MIENKYMLGLVVVSFALPLGISMSPSFSMMARSNPIAKEIAQSWEISQAFKSPRRAAPPGAAGAGTRGTCQQDPKDDYYVLLRPVGEVGLTLSEHPTFFLYVPQVRSRIIQLSLLARVDEDTEEPVASVNFRSPRQPGIISIRLPAIPKNSLKVDQLYRWEVEIVCDRTDRSGNVALEAFIVRTTPSQALAGNLTTIGDRDRATIYANNGIWYDSLAAAAQQRCASPNDPKVQENWEALLKSVTLTERSTDAMDLNKILKAPLLNLCRV